MTGPGSAEGAELRILRVFTAVVGVIAFFSTAGVWLVVDSSTEVAGGWYPTLPIAGLLVPLTAALLAPWAGHRLIRVLGGMVVAEYGLLVAMLLTGAALGRFTGTVPWSVTITAVPAVAAVVMWGVRAGWAALAISTALIQILRVLAGNSMQEVIASDVQVFFASAALLLLSGALIRASREFDRSSRAAITATAQRAAAQARSRASERLEAVVHDEILSTLVLAARAVPAMMPAVAAAAARTRQLIRELPEPEASGSMTVALLATELHALVADEAGDLVVEIVDARASGALIAAVPAEAAEALRGAVRQAVANSLTHAGRDAARKVTIEVRDTGLAIEVRDDGVGFDAAAVSPDRMGISSSIVRRLHSVPGGAADVRSRPGEGTVVRLQWSSAPRTRRADAAPSGVIPRDDGRARRVVVAWIGAFLVAQLGLAALAGFRAGELWAVSGAAFLCVALGFAANGWRTLTRPPLWRAWVVAGLAACVTALSLVPVPRDAASYGDTWYLAAEAFVLIVLAVRGRPWFAAGTGVLVVAVALAGAAAQANDAADVMAAVTRFVGILGIGVGLVVAIRRTERSTARVQREELDRVREAAAEDAARRELRVRVRELERLIGGLLERLATGAVLTEQERRECVALEGRLRDQQRGSRLARQPLTDTVMAARRRGVDVVLLDDAHDRVFGAAELDAIATWVADHLRGVSRGRFTARVLPAGRGPLASCVMGDEVVELRSAPRSTERSTPKGG